MHIDGFSRGWGWTWGMDRLANIAMAPERRLPQWIASIVCPDRTVTGYHQGWEGLATRLLVGLPASRRPGRPLREKPRNHDGGDQHRQDQRG